MHKHTLTSDTHTHRGEQYVHIQKFSVTQFLNESTELKLQINQMY